MDLVVGATGLVGGDAVRGLVEAGREVRALVRDPAERQEARNLEELGVEVVVGDLTRPESLVAACRGVDVVVCSATSMPDPGPDGLERVDGAGVRSLIEAAEEAGVGRFVYVSFSGNMEYDSPLRDAKRSAEERLAESPMQAVVLRPSFFMEVWLGPELGFDPSSGTVRLYGSGEAPVSYVSAHDVARFAVAAATREDGDSRVLEIGGPEAISQREAMRHFARELGAELEVERVPIEAIRAQHDAEDPLARTFGALMLAYAEGDVIENARDTAKRYEITLRSVADWARQIARGGDPTGEEPSA